MPTVLDRLYLKGLERRHAKATAAAKRLAVPVISVGNLTLGGTGKTPFTVWLAGWLKGQGHMVGVASRGYPLKLEASRLVAPGDDPAQVSDEGALMARLLDGIAHVAVGPDRFASGELLLKEKNITVLVLDDAFQHWWLQRDLDVVLLNAAAPFGKNKRLLPFGTLREPPGALRRAGAMVLSGAGGVAPNELDLLAHRLHPWQPHAPIVSGGTAPVGVVRPGEPEVAPLEMLQGKRAYLMSAIASPERFRHTVERLGAQVAGQRWWRDHHAFTRADLSAVCRAAQSAGADVVLCTEKDLVKLERLDGGPPVPLMAVRVAWEWVGACEGLEKRLRDSLSPLGAL